MHYASTCASIFLNLSDQLQMASALPSYKTKDVCSEPSVIASQPRSLNDLPEEILLNILSYFGPQDLVHTIAKICERWSALAKDMVLWKTLSYKCDHSSNIIHIEEVSCTTLLGFTTR